jgi:hypothetical protein
LHKKTEGCSASATSVAGPFAPTLIKVVDFMY